MRYFETDEELDANFSDMISQNPKLNKALREIKKKQDPDLLDSMCGYEDDSYDFFDKEFMGEEW